MALQRALSQRRHAFSRLISADFTSKAAPLLHPQRFHSGSGNPGQFNRNSLETEDEKSLFGDFDTDAKSSDPFYQKLNTIKRPYGQTNPTPENNTASSSFMEGLFEDFNSLDDGMDKKLGDAAKTFKYNEEIYNDDYKFRPDVTFRPGQTYTTQDLDLTKPGVQKSFKRTEFETTTKEVLKKADFRNVRFLANFLTEAGIIIKRSQTRISAKAQRKVAREIKTARAFGLMPFTTMGRKPFAFGASNKDEVEDYVFEDNVGSTPAGPYEGA